MGVAQVRISSRARAARLGVERRERASSAALGAAGARALRRRRVRQRGARLGRVRVRAVLVALQPRERGAQAAQDARLPAGSALEAGRGEQRRVQLALQRRVGRLRAHARPLMPASRRPVVGWRASATGRTVAMSNS